MLQEYAIYAVAVVSIGIMLLLCVDVVSKNNEKLNVYYKATTSVATTPTFTSTSKSKLPATTVVEKAVSLHEKPPVYPVYVDCSHEFMKNYLSSNASEINTPAPGQSA